MSAEDSARSEDSHWYNDPVKRQVMAAVAAAVPVALVNATAFIGQFAFLTQHVPWPVAGRVLIAVTIESIAVYLAWHAHLASMANDSALRLKLGAYGFALIVGVMNYSHYMAPGWHPTVLAVIMGLASAISPWLWGIYSRRASRDVLMGRNLIEEHAVRLGATRTFWHPLRVVRAIRWASWVGVNEPKVVLDHFAARYGAAGDPDQLRQDVPAQPDRDVPVQAGQAVPVLEQTVVPARQLVPEVTGQTGHMLIPGTTVNGVPVAGEAHLAADASLPARVPLTEAMVQAAELYLAGLPLDSSKPNDGLPGERALARDYLGDAGRRREARRLLAARRSAGSQSVAAASNGHPSRSPGMIATPVSRLPGGAYGG